MRTNRGFSLLEYASAIKKLLLNKISLFYFENFNSTQITLIRDGGIGDAILATATIKSFIRKYPRAKIHLVTNTPQIFKGFNVSLRSNIEFPFVHLTYGHYDLPVLRSKVKHIKHIIADTLRVKLSIEDTYCINLDNDKPHRTEELIPKTYVVLQPEASNWFKEKNWSPDRWENVVRALSDSGITVCQIGSEKDERIEGCKDYRGMLSLTQSLNLIKNARLLIGVNSFGEQAAAAFNIPAIILYGPTNPRYSLNQGQIAIMSQTVLDFDSIQNIDYVFKDLNDIPSELVINKLTSVLNLK
jgi:ADP-heptose:LPS heptosyltransferase